MTSFWSSNVSGTRPYLPSSRPMSRAVARPVQTCRAVVCGSTRASGPTRTSCSAAYWRISFNSSGSNRSYIPGTATSHRPAAAARSIAARTLATAPIFDPGLTSKTEPVPLRATEFAVGDRGLQPGQDGPLLLNGRRTGRSGGTRLATAVARWRS